MPLADEILLEKNRPLRALPPRRARWLQRWRSSRNGTPFVRTKDGLTVSIFKIGQGWSARLVDPRAGYIAASSNSYVTEEEAKLAAFDAIERYRERYPDR
jgi:hypothetical protein